jgi:hypothetical protein
VCDYIGVVSVVIQYNCVYYCNTYVHCYGREELLSVGHEDHAYLFVTRDQLLDGFEGPEEDLRVEFAQGIAQRLHLDGV